MFSGVLRLPLHIARSLACSASTPMPMPMSMPMTDTILSDLAPVSTYTSPTPIPTQVPASASGPPSCPAPEPFYEDFSNGFDSNKWLKAHKSWGSSGSFNNGGVVEENVVFNASAGKVILNAHGSLYTGDIMGVERVDGQWVRMNTGVRTGAAIATRNYFGAGSFEARLKVAGELGVCSAMWTYYYSDEGCSDGTPIANHEIDIEVPGRPGSALNDIGFDKALMVNWIGESGSLHTTNYTALDSVINDGNFHTWRFDWHTEESNRRIEFYVDGNLYAVNDKHVPFYAGRLWLGVWFPNRWAGDPNFAESQMEVDHMRFTPFLDEQYECPVESYPNSGWAPGTVFD